MVRIKLGQVVFAVVIVVAAAAAIWEISNSGNRGGTKETAQEALARCENVSDVYVQNLASGITVPGISLRDVQGVQSKDYKQVWFIAADIEGPGLSGSSHIGIWSTSSIIAPEVSGRANDLYAVNDLARQFTEWGLDVKLPVSKDADGISQATACTMKRLGTGTP
jgi:hypothetical protein